MKGIPRAACLAVQWVCGKVGWRGDLLVVLSAASRVGKAAATKGKATAGGMACQKVVQRARRMVAWMGASMGHWQVVQRDC